MTSSCKKLNFFFLRLQVVLCPLTATQEALYKSFSASNAIQRQILDELEEDDDEPGPRKKKPKKSKKKAVDDDEEGGRVDRRDARWRWRRRPWCRW